LSRCSGSNGFLQGFGLRFGERESGAQAERRRNAAGAKRPSANRRRKHADHSAETDAARDERAFLRNGTGVVVGGKGRPSAGEVKQKCALVKATKFSA